MISELWAVVPIKALDQAKSRLAPVMGPADRRALVLEMLRHTLSVLRSSDGLRGIVVIGPDPEVGEVVVAQGAEFLPEFGAGGLSGALAQAAASVAAREAQGILTIPGDLPQLRISGIRELLRLAAPAASSSRRTGASLARMRCW